MVLILRWQLCLLFLLAIVLIQGCGFNYALRCGDNFCTVYCASFLPSLVFLGLEITWEKIKEQSYLEGQTGTAGVWRLIDLLARPCGEGEKLLSRLLTASILSVFLKSCYLLTELTISLWRCFWACVWDASLGTLLPWLTAKSLFNDYSLVCYMLSDIFGSFMIVPVKLPASSPSTVCSPRCEESAGNLRSAEDCRDGGSFFFKDYFTFKLSKCCTPITIDWDVASLVGFGPIWL